MLRIVDEREWINATTEKCGGSIELLNASKNALHVMYSRRFTNPKVRVWLVVESETAGGYLS
jgi:hypothetical protein